MYFDKRSSERHETMGLMSTVSDGKSAFIGVVEDISYTGIRLSQVPAAFDDTVAHCYTVVKGPGKDITIVLRPCWTKTTNRGMYKVIGFQLENSSESWTSFVERVTTETDPLHVLIAESEMEM